MQFANPSNKKQLGNWTSNNGSRRERLFIRATTVTIAASALALFASTLSSQLRPTSAAPATGVINVDAIVDYSLTMTLSTEKLNVPVVPDNQTHTGQMSINVDTDNPTGYTLAIETTANTNGAGNTTTNDLVNTSDNTARIAATTGTVATPTALSSNTWGFCAPSTGSFDADCSTFANVPTARTAIKTTSTATASGGENTPITFGIRPNTNLLPGKYTAQITFTASANYPGTMYPIMQEMTKQDCTDMEMGAVQTVADARDLKPYQLKKMPDNKCWMVSDLAYTSGGDNTYGDVVTAGTTNALGTGQLHQIDSPTAASTVWTTANGTTNRFYTNNATEYVADGTKCTPTPTGTGVMQSACAPAGQDGSTSGTILYNWCAAMGLDSTTTPTCAAATNTGTGTGYAKTGIIGKANGLGGESKGNTTAGNPQGVNSSTTGSICPAGWRLPAGQVGSTNDQPSNANNEYMLLMTSLNTGSYNNQAPTTGYTVDYNTGYMGYWQPAGTSINAGTPASLGNAAFQAVSSGYFYPGSGLYAQSTAAYWWTSSLYSGTLIAFTGVYSSRVSPGTNNAYRYNGFAVRCVL